MEWNPRYVWYAEAHGLTPDEMLRYDRDRFPGGVMAGFLSWIGSRHREFLRAEGLRHDGIYDQARWDAWLERAAEERHVDVEEGWCEPSDGESIPT